MKVFIHPDGVREFIGERAREPLTWQERARVYELQRWLRCVKRCWRCGQLLPMDLFDLELNRCGPCVSDVRASAGRVPDRVRDRWRK